MIKDDKRELWKAHTHVIELCHLIIRLKDDKLSMKEQYELVNRIHKHAGLASNRIGQMVGREIDMFERMEFSDCMVIPPNFNRPGGR
jgi:hypothetical protein